MDQLLSRYSVTIPVLVDQPTYVMMAVTKSQNGVKIPIQFLALNIFNNQLAHS